MFVGTRARTHKATFNHEAKERERVRELRKEGRKGMCRRRGEPTARGYPDKYYCNYTLRFISCERALVGVDSIIYHGTLIKIIIRALNRGGETVGMKRSPFRAGNRGRRASRRIQAPRVYMYMYNVARVSWNPHL